MSNSKSKSLLLNLPGCIKLELSMRYNYRIELGRVLVNLKARQVFASFLWLTEIQNRKVDSTVLFWKSSGHLGIVLTKDANSSLYWKIVLFSLHQIFKWSSLATEYVTQTIINDKTSLEIFVVQKKLEFSFICKQGSVIDVMALRKSFSNDKVLRKKALLMVTNQVSFFLH